VPATVRPVTRAARGTVYPSVFRLSLRM
jgi:hypothetical protein